MFQKIVKSKRSIICMIVLLESFIAERFIFSIGDWGIQKACVYIMLKIGIVCFTLLMYQLCAFCRRTINTNGTRVFCVSFGIIMLIYLIYLILGWPGLWVGDNHIIFSYALDFKFYAVQSSITGFLYMLSMMIIPHPASVVLIHFLGAALIGAYVISTIYKFKESRKVFLLILLFISPAAVYYLFQVMRSAPFAYLLLFLEVRLADLLSRKEITCLGLSGGGTAIAAGLLASWRGEGKILFLIYCIIMIANYKKIQMKRLCAVIFCAAAAMACVEICDSLSWQGEVVNAKETYSLQPFITGLSKIVTSQKAQIDADDILNIDKVICVADLSQHASDLAPFNWSQEIGVRSDYTKDEYRACVKSILKLILNNLDIYIDSKLHLTINAVGAGNIAGFIGSGYTKEQTMDILSKCKKENLTGLFMPINDSVQESFYNILKGYYTAVPYTRIMYNFIWAIWIPIIILFVVMVLCLIRREWVLFLVSLLPVSEFCMVFMLCSMESAYYFISFYLAGWVNLWLLSCRLKTGEIKSV